MIPYAMPPQDDAAQTVAQLKARRAVRLEIADRDPRDSMTYFRNMAEAARLERLIRERSNEPDC